MADLYLHEHNAQIYESFRDCFARFYPSEQYAIEKAVHSKMKILDIGCNRAGLLNALQEKHGPMKYTGVDPDPKCLEIAKREFSNAEFILDVFPSKKIEPKNHDAVFCLSLFTHFTDWKTKLEELASTVTDKIIVDVAMTLEGPSITDPDVSYSYYLGSGQRVPYVILNALQFINFCFTEKIGASEVEIVGSFPKSDQSMAGMSLGKLFRGVAIITKDHSGKPIFGAQQLAHNPDFVQSVERERYRFPRARMRIDGEIREIYPKPV